MEGKVDQFVMNVGNAATKRRNFGLSLMTRKLSKTVTVHA